MIEGREQKSARQETVTGGLPSLEGASLLNVSSSTILKARLQQDGYAIVRGEHTEALFRDLCAGLGTVWHESDVKITKNGRQYFITPSSLPWHTDSPFANVIGWYARTPCPYKVGTKLLDLRDVTQVIAPGDISLLKQVLVPLPMASERAFEASGFYPLITLRDDGRALLNYLDWSNKKVPSPEHQLAVQRFREYLEAKSKTSVTTVVLNQGEMLFLDNNAFMHGRDSIPPDSPRHLLRLWINTNGEAQGQE